MMSSLTAIDGNYTQWTEWSDCGVTCGSGVQNRSRSCTNPTPQYDGKSCEDVGPADETKECNKNPCRKWILTDSHAKSFVRLDKFQESNSGRGKTVLIVFGTRGNKFWRQTPKSYLICDSILSNKRWQLKGTRDVETLYGGQFTRIINSVDENKLSSLISTNLHGYDLIGYFYSKAIDGNYTAWSKWSECSVTCGRGSRNRSRECINPSPQYGGKDCNVLGPANDIQECNKSACRKSCSKAVFERFHVLLHNLYDYAVWLTLDLIEIMQEVHWHVVRQSVWLTDVLIDKLDQLPYWLREYWLFLS